MPARHMYNLYGVWMNGLLAIYLLSNSILVNSGQWEAGNERRYAMEHHLPYLSGYKTGFLSLQNYFK